jgi:hypothetical protein
MDKSRTTADRVRPILEAMQRGIETARRQRMHDGPEPMAPTPPVSRPAPAAAAPTTTLQQPFHDHRPDMAGRMKARPKRAMASGGPVNDFARTEYRAQAG